MLPPGVRPRPRDDLGKELATLDHGPVSANTETERADNSMRFGLSLVHQPVLQVLSE